jgi:purine-nucleoside phosphorylase
MTHPTEPGDTAGAADFIRTRDVRIPDVVVVLGSGLGALAEAAADSRVFETTDLPGYPRSTVAGHRGRLMIGELENRTVLFIQGRVHLYEGHPVRAVTFPIRLAHELGATKLIVTNAAGGINRQFGPGVLMFIADHINAVPAGPLWPARQENAVGGPERLYGRNAAPYDPHWLDRAEQVALAGGISTRRGVYLWARGPSYETRAEIRMFERLGADAVGMSTVPEVLEARRLGLGVLGISTITNPAAGLGSEPLAHEDVLEVGRHVRADLERLVRAILRETIEVRSD